MEDSEIQKQFQEDNKAIAKRMRGILDSAGEAELNFFRQDDPQGAGIKLSGVSSEEDVVDAPMFLPVSFAPPEFDFPGYVFEEMHRDETDVRVTTPYGILDALVVGVDNKLYSFNNIYFFNLEGQAKKFESVFEETDMGSLEKTVMDIFGSSVDPNKIRRVNFTPHKEDTRYVDLALGDYEKIFGVLKQIESGEFKKI